VDSIAHAYLEAAIMPHYYFDIKDGHRLVDPAGRDCKGDATAKEMARVLAASHWIRLPSIRRG
jgi:hypothetical protein